MCNFPNLISMLFNPIYTNLICRIRITSFFFFFGIHNLVLFFVWGVAALSFFYDSCVSRLQPIVCSCLNNQLAQALLSNYP